MADHGGALVVFPRCVPSANETRIFVRLKPVSKISPPRAAELADVNVVSECCSFLKYSVTTQILKIKNSFVLVKVKLFRSKVAQKTEERKLLQEQKTCREAIKKSWKTQNKCNHRIPVERK